VERSRRIIRPPAPGDVWYVKVGYQGAGVALDTAEVLEMTDCTVLLKCYADAIEPGATLRYKLCDVDFVEFVRELPRAVEELPCPTPLKATAPR
jgi:hypothetical protein